MLLLLQIFRGALLGGGGLALGNGIALSYGGDHKVVTYVGWYVLAALLLAAGVVFWVEIHRRKEGDDQHNLATAFQGKSQYDDPPRADQGNRIYGGAAVGAAIRQDFAAKEGDAVFVAAEAEIALILEEAVELKRQLWDEWPHLAPELEEAIPDWREKTTDFIGKTLGAGQRAAFRAASVGSDTMVRLEAEEKFLADLARNFPSSSIRVNEEEFLVAREIRRGGLAAKFLDYERFRAPGAPPATLADQIHAIMHDGSAMLNEFSAPLEPEKIKGGWRLSEEEAPDDWWQRTQDLYDRAWGLLHDKAPGRIKTFGDAFNEHLDKAHAREGSKAPEDRLSTPKEIREFFASRHKEPALIVEAILEALAVVRNEMESTGVKAI